MNGPPDEVVAEVGQQTHKDGSQGGEAPAGKIGWYWGVEFWCYIGEGLLRYEDEEEAVQIDAAVGVGHFHDQPNRSGQGEKDG